MFLDIKYFVFNILVKNRPSKKKYFFFWSLITRKASFDWNVPQPSIINTLESSVTPTKAFLQISLKWLQLWCTITFKRFELQTWDCACWKAKNYSYKRSKLQKNQKCEGHAIGRVEVVWPRCANIYVLISQYHLYFIFSTHTNKWYTLWNILNSVNRLVITHNCCISQKA